jgi:DNA-binding transcriptional regulator YhcF (GntR family)
MRFWFVHSSDVSLQQQIVTQVSLGILSGEFAPGERLPSLRELARRFHLHPNTVSLGYRQLERDGWVELRRGAGVYVRSTHPRAAPSAPAIDGLIASLIQFAKASGLTADELQSRLHAALSSKPPERFLLLEPEPELQQIVFAELEGQLRLPISASALPMQSSVELAHAIVLALPSKAAAVQAALPPNTPFHTLNIRSVPASLAPWLPAPASALVAVASHWPRFLSLARTMLVAAGFDAEALLIRNAADPDWRNGLENADAVICDSYTARLLPPPIHTIRFKLLAPETIAELASYGS